MTSQPLGADSKAIVDRLCDWIANNSNRAIGWSDLITISGLSHQELIVAFRLHKKTTPIGYIRQCRYTVETNGTSREVPQYLRRRKPG